MKTVRNPSYGIGLARHHYLRVCGRCGYVLFVPESLIASDLKPAVRLEPKPARSKPARSKPARSKPAQPKPLKPPRGTRKKKDGA
jgi:hypothetical protein